jgi:transcriptional regulator with XRE-family HTH domain
MRGDRLRATREQRKLTREELVLLADISEQQLYRYELNKSDPTGDVLIRLATVLDVSTDYLLGLSDKPAEQRAESLVGEAEKKLLQYVKSGSTIAAFKALTEYIEDQEVQNAGKAEEFAAR